MGVFMGEVRTFADTNNDKEQALKPLEETAEVFGAWQRMRAECQADCHGCDCFCINHRLLIDECADAIQAIANLLDAVDVQSVRLELVECEERNMKRGREYAD